MNPEDLKYSKTHEWVQVKGKQARIGITAHAISELGDLTFLELSAEEGEVINQGDSFGEVESVKTTSELYSPISGKVIAVNEDLGDMLDELTDDPYETGWMIEVEIATPDEIEELLGNEAYEKHCQD
ncbi:glycine cleavage system protein GcvH [Candidatus Uabimicrobium amorphum]|uniref:Glycine cleavage system H protein n=1 Tax=Uabimicrobium amorphum TaxID=2596890 RepID=A0A5S9IUU6_UABAM|nr:glycine cleavage system protein GcvH [Candidatus Uabimicrobium amorphum]BBM87015.1 glycine cleavage system H protein [Candidatus Uabimicrobium amorphum]